MHNYLMSGVTSSINYGTDSKVLLLDLYWSRNKFKHIYMWKAYFRLDSILLIVNSANNSWWLEFAGLENDGLENDGLEQENL